MKKIIYDFKQAVKEVDKWYTPAEMATMLKDAALDLSYLIQDHPEEVCAMQIAVRNVTRFLDLIEEKEVEE